MFCLSAHCHVAGWGTCWAQPMMGLCAFATRLLPRRLLSNFLNSFCRLLHLVDGFPGRRLLLPLPFRFRPQFRRNLLEPCSRDRQRHCFYA